MLATTTLHVSRRRIKTNLDRDLTRLPLCQGQKEPRGQVDGGEGGAVGRVLGRQLGWDGIVGGEEGVGLDVELVCGHDVGHHHHQVKILSNSWERRKCFEEHTNSGERLEWRRIWSSRSLVVFRVIVEV